MSALTTAPWLTGRYIYIYNILCNSIQSILTTVLNTAQSLNSFANRLIVVDLSVGHCIYNMVKQFLMRNSLKRFQKDKD